VSHGVRIFTSCDLSEVEPFVSGLEPKQMLCSQSSRVFCLESAIHQSGFVVVLLVQHSDVGCQVFRGAVVNVNHHSSTINLYVVNRLNLVSECIRCRATTTPTTIGRCWGTYAITALHCERAVQRSVCWSRSARKLRFQHKSWLLQLKKHTHTMPSYNKVTRRTDTVQTKRTWTISWNVYLPLKYRFSLRGGWRNSFSCP